MHFPAKIWGSSFQKYYTLLHEFLSLANVWDWLQIFGTVKVGSF